MSPLLRRILAAIRLIPLSYLLLVFLWGCSRHGRAGRAGVPFVGPVFPHVLCECGWALERWAELMGMVRVGLRLGCSGLGSRIFAWRIVDLPPRGFHPEQLQTIFIYQAEARNCAACQRAERERGI